MVLSMLVALITCPAMLATAEAIRQGQGKERREEHRARRCNLVVSCVKASTRSAELENRLVVLSNGRVSRDQELEILERPSHVIDLVPVYRGGGLT